MATPAKVLLSILSGPLALKGVACKIAGFGGVVVVTLVTQLGGPFLWTAFGLAVVQTRPVARWLVVPSLLTAAYLVFALLAVPELAKLSGRVPLACFDRGASVQPFSPIFCFANRHYVTKDLARALRDVDTTLRARLPGRRVLFLDAGFPIGAGFPMLPHLSHGDGQRIDFAFLHRDQQGDPIDRNGSPIGYFAFVEPDNDARHACQPAFPTLRWDLKWLQPLLRKPALDADATRKVIDVFAENSQIRKILLEPHLRTRLGLTSSKVRFQGCRAARHDDHFHAQL